MNERLQDLTEENLDALMSCENEHSYWPKAWGTLQIDMRLLSDEQRGKAWEAARLLNEAGVTFDTGMGCGAIDWELDWSLCGAHLAVRPLYCDWRGCAGYKDRSGLTTAHWSLRRRLADGWMSAFPYCSEACRVEGDAGRSEATELVLHDTAPAWKLAEAEA